MSREHYAYLRGYEIGFERGKKRAEGVYLALSLGKTDEEIISEFEITKEKLEEFKQRL